MNPLTVVQPLSILLVALGGALGCMLRFAVINLIARVNPTPFPIGTLAVNVVGSFVIGFILARYGSEHSIRAFFATGLIGGFTTFSAFSWDALQLVQRGQPVAAVMYILGSVLLSLVAVYAGYQMGR